MAWLVFALVLFGAVLHATWNAIVKESEDKLATTVAVAVSGGLVAGLALPFLPQPAPSSWPFIAASFCIQVVYFVLVARVYHLADLSLAYPLMRGTAPLMVALASPFILGDRLPPLAWVGIGAICLGILTLVFRNRKRVGRGLVLILLIAALIAASALIDGSGVRRSGAPAAYDLWIFFLTAVPFALWLALARPERLIRFFRTQWHFGLIGGTGSVASYGLALWAMTRAPVAMVSALRETSILFGTLIAGLVLKERLGRTRVLAAVMIVLGAVGLRLAR